MHYAGGPGRFRYLLYKDVNRHMKLSGRIGWAGRPAQAVGRRAVPRREHLEPVDQAERGDAHVSNANAHWGIRTA